MSGSCSLDRSLYLVLLLICRTQQNCSYRRNSCSKRRSLSCFSRCCPKTLSSKTLLSRTSYKVSLVASLIANHRLSRCSILLTITMPRISSSKLGPQEKNTSSWENKRFLISKRLDKLCTMTETTINVQIPLPTCIDNVT